MPLWVRRQPVRSVMVYRAGEFNGETRMLLLSRKVHEQIQIGDDIVITVVRISGNLVKLGIEAPRDVPVHRGEVAAKIESGQSP
jgi:carbon storage regulator